LTKHRSPLDGDALWKWCLRIGGMVGLFWETIYEKVDRPELLIIFCAMMGLDTVLSHDAKRREQRQNSESRDDS
jgi:hypothetical protein